MVARAEQRRQAAQPLALVLFRVVQVALLAQVQPMALAVSLGAVPEEAAVHTLLL